MKVRMYETKHLHLPFYPPPISDYITPIPKAPTGRSVKCMSYLKSLSWSQLKKCIPKQWQRPPAKLIDPNPMTQHLVVSLKNLSRQGHVSQAFKIFSLIKQQRPPNHASSSPSSYGDTVVHCVCSLLHACGTYKLLQQGEMLHAQVFSMGFAGHCFLVPKLVGFYTSLDFYNEAHLAMREDSCSGVMVALPWNLLISCYVNNGQCSRALSVYTEMLERGIVPDNFTYPAVLKACSQEFDLDFGREVHRSIEVNADKLGWNLFVQNALVAMYGRCGELGTARQLFDKMLERDGVSWNSMISAYARKEMWQDAFQVFNKMNENGVDSNIITWNMMVGGYLRVGNFRGALSLLAKMKLRFGCLDSVAMLNGLGACSHTGAIKLGKEVHGCIVRQHFDGFDNVRNTLITMYGRCEDLEHARLVFELTEDKSRVTWHTMLTVFAEMGRFEEASLLFREMLLSGFEPNDVTIAIILPLCARTANLRHGREFHCYLMRRDVFKDYLLLWNALVDMYAKSAKIIEAERVFDSLKEKDEVTYTSLISGYGMHGRGQRALELYEEMKKLKIKLDHITMVAVLSACSHSGFVRNGEILFEEMQWEYGISPHLEHYACIVDLYGRSGLLQKAKQFIMSMPFKPTAAMWATLLGACQIHRNTEIGEWAGENLLRMKSENSGYYVLIANMYSTANSLDKRQDVRVFMRDLGVKKDPGRSSVVVGSELFSFSAGDTSSPVQYEYHPMLRSLSKLMKDADSSASEDFSSSDEILEASH